MKKKNNKAFSLIEIAVVMIIIGILVAGITQSKKLIAQTRINTARSNTLSAPVISTPGLLVWFETVLDKSFIETEQEDMAQVSKWLDLNNSSSLKFDLVQSNASNRPNYIIKGINDLPSLEFLGNNYLEIPYNLAISPVSFTIFIVSKIKILPISQVSTILCNNSSNRGFIINSFLNGAIPNYQIGLGDDATLISQNLSSAGNAFNKADLVTIIHSGTTLTSFYNSTTSSTISNNFAINIDKKLTVGVNNCNLSLSNFLQGQIGEIIFFERNLKSEERISIEKYLGRKWGIRL
jgi:prepilin-type N-terminal cleavage/methylation domain-containing protein